jgi:D-3-phosphoglycerate dehydrogenase
MLDSISDTPINYINALHLALERGIRVTETRGLASSSYANQVLCRVKWEDGERVVVGSLLGDQAPRVVQIDSFRLEANLEGIILVVESVDRPGVISRVSTLLPLMISISPSGVCAEPLPAHRWSPSSISTPTPPTRCLPT